MTVGSQQHPLLCFGIAPLPKEILAAARELAVTCDPFP